MSSERTGDELPANRAYGRIVSWEPARSGFLVRCDDGREIRARPGRGVGCLFGPFRLAGRRVLVSIRTRSPGFGTLLRIFPEEPVPATTDPTDTSTPCT